MESLLTFVSLTECLHNWLKQQQQMEQTDQQEVVNSKQNVINNYSL